MLIQLHWYNIDLRTVLASQYQALEGGRKKKFMPLASGRDWLWRRNNHQGIIVSLDNAHYTHDTSFFDVPICHSSPKGKISKSKAAWQAWKQTREYKIYRCIANNQHLPESIYQVLLACNYSNSTQLKDMLKEFLQWLNLDSNFSLLASPT